MCHSVGMPIETPPKTLEQIWGQRVKHWRTGMRWSQRQLAEKVGTTQQTIWKIEHGLIAPRDAMKIRLAEVLGLRVRQLFPWADEL